MICTYMQMHFLNHIESKSLGMKDLGHVPHVILIKLNGFIFQARHQEIIHYQLTLFYV